MAAGTTSGTLTHTQTEPSQSYVVPMALMVTLYFSIGFITALNDILVSTFSLNASPAVVGNRQASNA